MTEKKETKDKKEGIIDKLLSSGIMNHVNEAITLLVKKGQDAIYLTQKKVIEKFISILILFTGSIFVVVGISLLINDYFNLKEGWGFFFVGLFMLIFAIGLSSYIKRTRYIK